MIYLIKDYIPESNEHYIQNETTRGTIKCDLFVDGSFAGVGEFGSIHERDEYCKSLIGKKVSIEDFTPIAFAACNVSIID